MTPITSTPVTPACDSEHTAGMASRAVGTGTGIVRPRKPQRKGQGGCSDCLPAGGGTSFGLVSEQGASSKPAVSAADPSFQMQFYQVDVVPLQFSQLVAMWWGLTAIHVLKLAGITDGQYHRSTAGSSLTPIYNGLKGLASPAAAGKTKDQMQGPRTRGDAGRGAGSVGQVMVSLGLQLLQGKGVMWCV